MFRLHFLCIVFCLIISVCCSSEGDADYIELKKELKDPDENIRAAAAGILGIQYSDKPELVDIMIDLLDDKHWKVKVSAAYCLGLIGARAEKALPKLEELLLLPELESREKERETVSNAIDIIRKDSEK